MYFKGTLDKLGIQFEVEHMGKYKDAGDMLTRKDMSPETKESLNALLDGIWSNVTSTIGPARRMKPRSFARWWTRRLSCAGGGAEGAGG